MPYLTASIISSLAALITITVCIIAKTYLEPLGKMLIAINTADLLYCSVQYLALIFPPESDHLCKVFQMISLFGALSSCMWGAFFGHGLMLLVRSRETGALSRVMPYYIVFAIGCPFGLSIGSLFTNFATASNQDCIHTFQYGEHDLEFIAFVAIPIVITCVLCIIWFILAARQLKKLGEEEGSIKGLFVLVMYPGVMILCWTPVIIVALLIFFEVSVDPSVILIAQAFDQLHGFFNAIVYGGSTSAFRVFGGCCFWRKKARVRVLSLESISSSSNNSSVMVNSSMKSFSTAPNTKKQEDFDVLNTEFALSYASRSLSIIGGDH